MIISKVKYEELVRSRDGYKALAEKTIALNAEILSSNGRLLDILKHDVLEHPEKYLDDTMAIVDDMTMAQRRELLKYLEDKIEGNKKEITKEEREESLQ